MTISDKIRGMAAMQVDGAMAETLEIDSIFRKSFIKSVTENITWKHKGDFSDQNIYTAIFDECNTIDLEMGKELTAGEINALTDAYKNFKKQSYSGSVSSDPWTFSSLSEYAVANKYAWTLLKDGKYPILRYNSENKCFDRCLDMNGESYTAICSVVKQYAEKVSGHRAYCAEEINEYKKDQIR